MNGSRDAKRSLLGQTENEFDHVWRWNARLPERKGQSCRVLARGRMNSVLVEFVDGARVITSRWAVMPGKPDDQLSLLSPTLD